MPQHSIVVIGGSAGSLQPLTDIINNLPADLRASVLVVMHTGAGANGYLPEVLRRSSKLPVGFAPHGAPIEPGRIYVAKPDMHLIVSTAGLRVVHGPRENGFRPAIDPLFRTAARELGPRVIGIVLSGALSDGTYGLSLIKQHGGVAIVQDPGDATFDSMPRNALNAVDVDYILPAAEIGPLIARLTHARVNREPIRGEQAMANTDDDLEPQLPSKSSPVAEMEARFGAASSLTCPDCGGALWEVEEGRVVRYQCHTGHQYAPDALDAEQRDAVDSALWSAVRVLEEHAALKNRMAQRAADHGLDTVSNGFAEGARDAHSHAQKIRSLLFATPGEADDAAPVQRRAAAAERRPSTRRQSRTRARKKPRR